MCCLGIHSYYTAGGKNQITIGVIEIDVTEEQLKRAETRFEFEELRGSITKGDGNLAGALGEVVVLDLLKQRGNKVVDISTYDYDLKANGLTIDVKSKRINVPPRGDFRVTVSGWNTKQRCDYYMFTHVMGDMSKVYVGGYMSKKDFFDKARFYKKGELDPEDKTNREWRFSYDCYVMNLDELNKLL